MSAPRHILPTSGRGLGGKLARVASRSKPTLGLVFFHNVNFPLSGGNSPILVLCSWQQCSHALIPPDRSVLLCPTCGKKAFSDQIRSFLSEEQVWSGFKARETSCTQRMHREQWVATSITLGLVEAYVGQRQEWIPRAILHWGWPLFTELTFLCPKGDPRGLLCAFWYTGFKP